MRPAHIISAKYMPATDTRGSRVKLVSQWHSGDSVAEGYDYARAGTYEQAAAMLQALGYTIVAVGEAPRAYIFAVAEFTPLRQAAAQLAQERATKKEDRNRNR